MQAACTRIAIDKEIVTHLRLSFQCVLSVCLYESFHHLCVSFARLVEKLSANPFVAQNIFEHLWRTVNSTP
jgi:hypothetical protein